VSIRVCVARFAPSRSQRRRVQRNGDLRVNVAMPVATDEKFALYRRYQSQWHGKPEDDWDSFVSFLYDSPVPTIECEYRDESGRLLAVGICDVCPPALSAVYFYFEPGESRRGLGTFGAMWEIGLARRLQLEYYYLGYWIRGCGSMEYKSDYRPYELLGPDGVWREGGDPAPSKSC
jgi:leucyl-tRNA---protein transferase